MESGSRTRTHIRGDHRSQIESAGDSATPSERVQRENTQDIVLTHSEDGRPPYRHFQHLKEESTGIRRKAMEAKSSLQLHREHTRERVDVGHVDENSGASALLALCRAGMLRTRTNKDPHEVIPVDLAETLPMFYPP